MKIQIEDNNIVVDGKEYPCIRIDGTQYVTVHQLAEMTGYVHQTIRVKIRNGIIQTHKRNNGRVLVSIPEVQRLVADGVLIKNICR